MRTAKRDEQLGAVQNRVKEAYTAVFKAETKATACQAELAHGIDTQAQQQAEQAAMAVETQVGISVEAEPVQKTDRYQAGVTRADSG